MPLAAWEYLYLEKLTCDTLGNSCRDRLLLLPSDALRAAERTQRFTNELSL